MQSKLQKKDLEYNWHPYTQHKTSAIPIVIKSGKKTLLFDENGNAFIDAIGSWWANPHGHSNKKIAKAICKQINTLEHVLFGGFTHPTAIKLSGKLLKATGNNFQKVFYSDNGSTAVEVALKMSLQYHLQKNGEKKKYCIAFEDAFHGDTFGAMASSGISFFSNAFQSFLLSVKRIPLPNDTNWEEVLIVFESYLKENDCYAFIFEPLVQGAAGMKIYKAEYLDKLIALAKKYEVLCIADEVMTGFGRTGKLFAIDYLENKPDIICLSKALTGGFIPLSATLCTNDIYNQFYDDDIHKAFFHGHTFMANPAGCAAAIASLNISTSLKTKKNILRIKKQYIKHKKLLEKYTLVENIRNLGVVFAFDIKTNEKNEYYGNLRNRMYKHYINEKIIIRPVGNTVYYLPPYCITNEELDRVFSSTIKLLNSFS